MSIVGLVIALIGTSLTEESEKHEIDQPESQEEEEQSFSKKLNQNMSQIG